MEVRGIEPPWSGRPLSGLTLPYWALSGGFGASEAWDPYCLGERHNAACFTLGQYPRLVV